MRYAMLLPVVLMIASLVTGCLSYSDAKQSLTDDLNDAMIALANDNSELWTARDTVAALRQMHKTTGKPLMFQASDIEFRNSALRKDAYYTLALVDRKRPSSRRDNHGISSDSIMLFPATGEDGVSIQLQGFADCSVASVFSSSDMTVPGLLLALSFLSMATLTLLRRREQSGLQEETAGEGMTFPTLDGVKLTPMQRQLARMLLDAPGNRVDKATLCLTLWGGKSNAEESLYTLVRRTKTALADTGIEIVCNRGDSYELRLKD